MNTPTLSQQKRDAILGAALLEFEARGFRETSMDRIAATAGVSKRTVYNHFTSKSALIDAIAEQLVDRIHHSSSQLYDSQRPLDDQLHEIGQQILSMLTSKSFVTLARVTIVEVIRSPERARHTYELFREQQTGLEQWLAAATVDGRLAVEDPVWATDQFVGLLQAVAFWPQILGDQPVPDEQTGVRIVDSAVAMLLSTYQVRT